MKKILISLIGLIGILGFVACDDETPEVRQERKVFYTHSEGAGLPAFSGTTVRLTTDAEWDALLDRFCDYAQDGEQVTFYSTNSNYQAKGNSSATPTSITTADREELKAWMKEMEKIGKTVQVTFDEGSGTWNGRAYANLGQGDMQESKTYTGTMVFVPTPVLETPPLGGVVWAMQVNADSTLIIAIHGMTMWNDSIDDNMRLLEGATMTFEGVAGSHIDLEGNPFMTISLNVEEEK